MIEKKERHPKIETDIKRYISDNNFTCTLVAISGGADSIALLSALASSKIKVIAAHCNFHLRGEESMRDQHHVDIICKQLNIPLLIKDFDVEEYKSRKKSCSTEMACRELRYKWFEDLAKEVGAERIATGHNADDNIETLFLNLLRGSGTTGLRGMSVDNGKIWRPLLSFHRNEIEQYLNQKKLKYITDSSNLTSDYRRNYLRNTIFPLLQEKWSGFNKALDRSLSIIRGENQIVENAVSSALPAPGQPLKVSEVLDFPFPELLIRRFISPGGPFTNTSGEIMEAIRAKKPDKKKWTIRNGELLLRNGNLYLSLRDFNNAE